MLYERDVCSPAACPYILSETPPRLRHTHKDIQMGQVTILQCCKISVLYFRVGLYVFYVGLSRAGWVFSDLVTLVSDTVKAVLVYVDPWVHLYNMDVTTVMKTSGLTRAANSMTSVFVCILADTSASMSQHKDTSHVKSILNSAPPMSVCIFLAFRLDKGGHF